MSGWCNNFVINLLKPLRSFVKKKNKKYTLFIFKDQYNDIINANSVLLIKLFMYSKGYLLVINNINRI